MTKNEMESLEKEIENNPTKYSKEEIEKIRHENSVREMIMCCLVYGQESSFYDEKTYELGKYGLEYFNRYEDLTKGDIVRLFYEQKVEFEKGILKESVYTDWEGVTYNSFKYADEM